VIPYIKCDNKKLTHDRLGTIAEALATTNGCDVSHSDVTVRNMSA